MVVLDMFLFSGRPRSSSAGGDRFLKGGKINVKIVCNSRRQIGNYHHSQHLSSGKLSGETSFPNVLGISEGYKTSRIYMYIYILSYHCRVLIHTICHNHVFLVKNPLGRFFKKPTNLGWV